MVRVKGKTVVFNDENDLCLSYPEKEYEDVIKIASLIYNQIFTKLTRKTLDKFIDNYLTKFTFIGFYSYNIFTLRSTIQYFLLIPN